MYLLSWEKDEDLEDLLNCEWLSEWFYEARIRYVLSRMIYPTWPLWIIGQSAKRTPKTRSMASNALAA